MFVTIAIFSFYAYVQFENESYICQSKEKSCECEGYEIFNLNVQECLDIMEATALKYSETGVAVVSFVPGEDTKSWNSRMRVVGTLSTKNHNFLGVASAKSAEMAVTLQNSGTSNRPPLIGELGYKGGVIQKVSCGYLIASFSGAPSEIDAEISKVGVHFLSKLFESH
ncbi:hypothetical protein [Algibacter lectus]|uniref:Uncharacterized protein n=1 Tax=Algibacter lectus TaxID=221126 RepID=A0A4R8MF81_9FLAO|nr:hypothetical protein [Algibacter lectus]TDY64064.1 hypothetical protein DFQ06_0965 [Algibacter lectus]